METILVALMIVLYTLQSFLCARYSECYPGQKSMASPVFTVVSGLVVAVVLFAFSGFRFEVSALTVVLGVVNAFVLFGYNTCLIKASQSGPYSVLMVFLITGGIMLPSLVAALWFHEVVSVGKMISILVILAAVYMTSRKPGESSAAGGFLLSCAALSLCNGAYGTLLDVQQRLTSSAQSKEMAAVTYLCAMLLSSGVIVVRQGKHSAQAMRQTKKSLVYLLLCSVTAALAINLLVYVLSIVNVTVLYTFENSGVFLLSVLISYIVFKEKLSVLNCCGCAAMCAGLIGMAIL